MAKDRFRAKTKNKWQPKNWQARNEREDDQIAPKAAAASIDTLQRWAHATADIAQDGHRANESLIVARIRDRYEKEAYPLSHHKHTGPELETENSKNMPRGTNSRKRKPSSSPIASSQPSTLFAADGIEEAARQSKRRRAKSPGGSSIDADDRYAQSSEWSFPDEDEVKMAKTTTEPGTHIEID